MRYEPFLPSFNCQFPYNLFLGLPLIAELQYAIKSEIGSRDVFITHCPSHRHFVQRLQKELERSFITSWTNSFYRERNWKEKFDSELSTTSVVLCVITDNLHTHEQCMEELALAKEKGIPSKYHYLLAFNFRA